LSGFIYSLLRQDSELNGYWVDDESYIVAAVNGIRRDGNRNIFATVAQAKSSIALAMLSQQVADCNGDWTPDWKENTTKCRLVRLSLFFHHSCYFSFYSCRDWHLKTRS
jgi:hypothetical protein